MLNALLTRGIGAQDAADALRAESAKASNRDLGYESIIHLLHQVCRLVDQAHGPKAPRDLCVCVFVCVSICMYVCMYECMYV